ncbi:type II/IV secretion system protein [Candidatus Sulfurimonas marisnigri]|uniref:Type II/IV secretion system protein n=1 Tax=Candidatus Sulfurimonas marisnigri TaxID=2740405 RepID=A0A7S7RPV7_9BACT|nr:GspE/PulE family protein [Candidatus Sulfurimonas marisnigri]QOY53908.1 type II/IV secretion system protein [Candidatus Sulfurimonas marisnigri]
MLNLEPLHNLKLYVNEPWELDTDISVKNYLLFSEIDNEVCALVCERYLVEASNYYTKLQNKYPIKMLDEDSYDRLYNRFLELRTDKAIETMKEDSSEEGEDEDISLTDFLRTSSDILTSEESAPIIKFVNALFYQAIKKRASDIHIEVQEKRGEVRFRIDGMLSKNADLDKKVVNLIISRIKVISNLDISEKRIPQDGRTQIKIAGETLDIRVSVLPTFYGERVVMRLLMQSSQIPQINELGFCSELVEDVKKLLRSSHGIILVTGPTGSGKTTSLHSFLREVESPEKNLITVEDPVEYKSDNIAQIQVNEKVGLTFASALRSILRQDPDVIMIGEIRDEETAAIAIRAALTGHLVFSTLHTNSAAATISRLADMSVEPFLISSSLLGVLAQRLIRVLCEECKVEDALAENFAEDYRLQVNAKIFKAKGCKSCNYSGYSGRRSIGELLIMNDKIKDLLKSTTDEHTIKIALEADGLKTISFQLSEMLYNGETSLDEAIRIGLGNA